MHPLVAELCLAEKKNLVTASYVSPAMKAMADKVEQAGLTFLNEMGLDPGIDHMSAMKIIDEVCFISVCFCSVGLISIVVLLRSRNVEAK
jgi:saccharopine dehydrogenase-like NADP-dependent oxidoreductase